jgi:hypothetical protein
MSEKRYVVEADNTYRGLRLVVILQRIGFRCGYVAIPAGMHCHGKTYSELPFNVHGGLTFSAANQGYPAEENSAWWIGFDCGHYGDGFDVQAVFNEFGFDERILRMSDGGVVWTKCMVEEECRSLIDQIIEREKIEETSPCNP